MTVINMLILDQVGGLAMKKLSTVAKKMVARASEAVVSSNVNSACVFVVHQPKLPKGAEKFRKK